MYIVHNTHINISTACSVSLFVERSRVVVEHTQQVDSRWDVRFMSFFICFPPLDLWVCHEQLKHAGQAKGPDKAERDRLTTHWPAQMYQRTLNLKLPTMDKEETLLRQGLRVNLQWLTKVFTLLKFSHFVDTTSNWKKL